MILCAMKGKIISTESIVTVALKYCERCFEWDGYCAVALALGRVPCAEIGFTAVG